MSLQGPLRKNAIPDHTCPYKRSQTRPDNTRPTFGRKAKSIPAGWRSQQRPTYGPTLKQPRQLSPVSEDEARALYFAGGYP